MNPRIKSKVNDLPNMVKSLRSLLTIQAIATMCEPLIAFLPRYFETNLNPESSEYRLRLTDRSAKTKQEGTVSSS